MNKGINHLLFLSLFLITFPFSEQAGISGDVTIRPGCTISSSASINAEAGPIILGERSIVEQYAKIFNRHAGVLDIGSNSIFAARSIVEAHEIGDGNIFEGSCVVGPQNPGGKVSIGSGNIFGWGCKIESPKIGRGNIFKSKCYVGPGVTVGNGCIIAAGAKLTGNQHIPDGAIVG